MDRQVLHKLEESRASFNDALIKVKDGHNMLILNLYFFIEIMQIILFDIFKNIYK